MEQNFYGEIGTAVNKFAWLTFMLVMLIAMYNLTLTQVLLCTTIIAALFILFRRTEIRVKPFKDIISPTSLLIIIIAVGIALRILWINLYPITAQTSDFKSYWDAAVRIVNEHQYYYDLRGSTLVAWRPIGYPAFLALFIFLFGENPLIPSVMNIAIYATTCLVCFKLGSILSNERAGLIAALLLTLWPSHIFATGLASSEPISLMLFTMSAWLFLKSYYHHWTYSIATGIVTAFCALIKPAVIMLPFLWLLYLIMSKQKCASAFSILFISTIMMVLTVSPWTYRNYTLLDSFVPISTNGGSVFYRANNPDAWGGYSLRGEKDIDQYLDDEVLWNKTGFKWGKQWIIENPLEFFSLALKKQGLFLREDGRGLQVSIPNTSEAQSSIEKTLRLISRAWWISIIILCTFASIKHYRYFSKESAGGFLLWMILFFVVVHSVFESSSRYHMPMIGLMAVLAAFSFFKPHLQRTKT